jgi:hypothetical protein
MRFRFDTECAARVRAGLQYSSTSRGSSGGPIDGFLRGVRSTFDRDHHHLDSSRLRNRTRPRKVWVLTAPTEQPITQAVSASDRSPLPSAVSASVCSPVSAVAVPASSSSV